MSLPELGGRKRYRVERDEVEFAPLSKRINNLHINNGFLALNEFQEQENSDFQNGLPNTRLEQSHYHSRMEESRSQWNMQSHPHPHYRPDLTPSENPHYYESNRLLYELHLEKCQRSCSSNIY